MENIAAFWAVLRCAGPKADNNMELDVLVFRDAGCEVKGGQYPKFPKGVELSVELPIIRNVRPIEKGEVLCLPFRDEDE